MADTAVVKVVEIQTKIKQRCYVSHDYIVVGKASFSIYTKERLICSWVVKVNRSQVGRAMCQENIAVL